MPLFYTALSNPCMTYESVVVLCKKVYIVTLYSFVSCSTRSSSAYLGIDSLFVWLRVPIFYPILAHTQLLELKSWLPILWACDSVFFYALLMFCRQLLELQSWLPILGACDHVFFYELLMFCRQLLELQSWLPILGACYHVFFYELLMFCRELLEWQSWLPILWACDHVLFYALLMFCRELLHTLLTLKLTLGAYQSRFMTELDLTDYKQLMLDVHTFVCNQCFRNFIHCQTIYITTQCAYPTFHKSDVSTSPQRLS